MSVENGDPGRRHSAPVPAWEQRGPQGAPAPGHRPPPRHGAGPVPQGVRPGPPPGDQRPPNRLTPPAPSRPGFGPSGPPQTPPSQPPPRRLPPQASPAPLSGPAAGIGGLADGAGNAYSQTTEPEDRRQDNYNDYAAAYPDAPVEDHELGAEMTPAPTSRANSTNRLAVAALVFSVIGVTFIVGIICGHISRSQIRRTGEQGGAFAIAALWVGYLYLAATVLVLGGYFYIVGTGN